MSLDPDGFTVLEALSRASTREQVHSIFNPIKHLAVSSQDIQWIYCVAYANILLDSPEKAIHCLMQNNDILSSSVETYVLLGLAYRSLGDHDESALHAYQTAILLEPKRADILYNIANILSDTHDSSCINYYLRSLSINPLLAQTWHNLAIYLSEINLYTYSRVALIRSILLDPHNSDAWCNLGLCFKNLDNSTKAINAFKTAISYDTLHRKSCTNIGNLLVDKLQPHEALTFLEKGLDSDCKSFLNLALCQLKLGDLKNGWFYYDSRLSSFKIPIDSPRLTSLELINSSSDFLIIWAEQGLGDSIMFCRYLFLLDQRGINWKFYCQPQLLSLLKSCSSFKGEFLCLDLIPSSSFSYNVPLLSLPRLFDTTLSTIPAFIPYINSTPSVFPPLVVTPPPGGLSVGLVWASDSSNLKMYKDKSIPLILLMSSLNSVIDLGLVQLHSFQVGVDSNQISSLSNPACLKDWSSLLVDFSCTAQLVSQMDLIISVDTAVAHLSAAMNIPTWLLLAANSDFRWFTDRDDSPWYPSVMRLFRQHHPGDWSSVLAQIDHALESILLLDTKSLFSNNEP